MSKLGFATVLSGFRKSAGKQENVQEKDLDLPKDEPKSVESFLLSAENMGSLSIGNMDLSCSNLSEAKKKENPKKITERIFKKFITNDNSAKLWISKETEVSKGHIGEEGAKTTSQIVSEVMKKIESMVASVKSSKTETSKSEVFNLTQDSYNAIMGAVTAHEDPDIKKVRSAFENGVAAFTYEKEVPSEDAKGGTDEGGETTPGDAEKKPENEKPTSDAGKGGLAVPDYLEGSEDKDSGSESGQKEESNNDNTNTNNNNKE